MRLLVPSVPVWGHMQRLPVSLFDLLFCNEVSYMLYVLLSDQRSVQLQHRYPVLLEQHRLLCDDSEPSSRLLQRWAEQHDCLWP